jgi:hypothetical protein
VKKNSISLLTDAYTSPLLINTLIKEGVPVYTKSERLKTELRRYCPDLILLDETEAANIITRPESLIFTNSDEGLSTIRGFLTNPSEIEVHNSFKDKSDFGRLLPKALPDLSLPGAETESVRGDEFSCDVYFNAKGKPIVLGIYAHPFLDGKDSRDIVYYTSREIVRKNLPRMEASLEGLSSESDLKNLPFHAKFRLHNGDLLPIEVDPGRFGSFSLSDLLFFAFGMNPYKQYFRSLKPDWDSALPLAEGDIFFRVLSRLPVAVPAGKKPDHEAFADTFRNLVGYCKLDTDRYPAFSIAFGRTDNLGDVKKYLEMDFKNYLT